MFKIVVQKGSKGLISLIITNQLIRTSLYQQTVLFYISYTFKRTTKKINILVNEIKKSKLKWLKKVNLSETSKIRKYFNFEL